MKATTRSGCFNTRRPYFIISGSGASARFEISRLRPLVVPRSNHPRPVQRQTSAAAFADMTPGQILKTDKGIATTVGRHAYEKPVGCSAVYGLQPRASTLVLRSSS